MRKGSSSLLMILLALAAAAQQKPEEKPGNVEGIVTHASTGAPILRAHVMCDGFINNKQLQFGAMTDAEGKFSIKGLPPGTYGLRVERIGFVPSPGPGVVVRPDSTSDAKVKLTPTGAILGRVLDHDGNPVEGAGVYAEGSSGNRTMNATTNHKGQYRIGGLAPGRYRIRAAPMAQPLPFPPEIRTDGSEEVRLVSTYHPNGIDRKSGTRLDLGAGAELTGVDVRLLRAPMVRVSGIVTGIPAGLQPGSIGIETRTDNMAGRSAMVGADGKFELWNPDPGKWLISAVQFRGEQARSAGLELEIGTQNIDGLELRMIAPFDVTGQAVFEDESAKPRPQTPNGPPPRMALQEVNRLGGARGTQPIVLPEDGAFKFSNVSAGRYRINYGWRASVRAVRLGTVEMENQILDLSNGTAGAPITVVFGPANAEVSGTVRDDKGPVGGALVVLRNTAISMGSTNAAYRQSTKPDGTFHFGNVPTGKYVLVAADDGDMTPVAENYDDYEDVLVELQVGSGERLTRDLKRHNRSR